MRRLRLEVVGSNGQPASRLRRVGRSLIASPALMVVAGFVIVAASPKQGALANTTLTWTILLSGIAYLAIYPGTLLADLVLLLVKRRRIADLVMGVYLVRAEGESVVMPVRWRAGPLGKHCWSRQFGGGGPWAKWGERP